MTEFDTQDLKNLVYLLMYLRHHAKMDFETLTLWNAMLHNLEAAIEQAEGDDFRGVYYPTLDDGKDWFGSIPNV